MFTGTIQDTGTVAALTARGGDVRLTIRAGKLDLSRTAIGDSICVQGCCVTAVALSAGEFEADLSRETLSLTTLGQLGVGAAVNLEPRCAGDAESTSLSRTCGWPGHPQCPAPGCLHAHAVRAPAA